MVGDAWRRTALAALGRLPLHLLTRLAGRAASLRLPRRLRRPLLLVFARATRVDLREVPRPLEAYPSLQAFFTRALPPDARPPDPRRDSVLAPCDGRVGAFGAVERGRLLQVKGRWYRLAELLGDAAEAEGFEGGRFATFYLAPGDYHRFHAPCAGRVVALRYLPGALWPVNRLGVEGVEALFARNERLVASFELDGAPGGTRRPGGEGAPGAGSGSAAPADVRRAGRLAVVAVAAALVGCVRVRFDDLRTGGGRCRARDTSPVVRHYAPGIAIARGEEWGRFEFGSTLVVVAEPGLLEWELPGEGTPVRVGQRVGRLLRGSAGAPDTARGGEEEGRCAHPAPR